MAVHLDNHNHRPKKKKPKDGLDGVPNFQDLVASVGLHQSFTKIRSWSSRTSLYVVRAFIIISH